MAALDPEAQGDPRGIIMTVDGVPVTIIMDIAANRMRILVPVASAEGWMARI